MRVFLDANILFSAAKSDGAVRRLVELLVTSGHACVVNEYVIVEARRNLERKGPDALAVLDLMLTRLEVGATALPLSSVLSAWLPEKDRPVLESAVAARCDALVTGDRTHFATGHGKVFGGVTVYSPRGLAEALFGR